MAPDLIFITDTAKFDPLPVCKTLPPGSIVILRDYDMPEKQRLELAKLLQKACKKRHLWFLIGKTPEMAAKIKADGIHLPEFMVKDLRRLRYKYPHFIITAAAHSRYGAYRAYTGGADAVLISPVFNVSSHPGSKPLGLHRAKNLVLPYIYSYALGGCRPGQLGQLKAIGFQGVAGVSGYKLCGYKAT